jgi:hypothetical protein
MKAEHIKFNGVGTGGITLCSATLLISWTLWHFHYSSFNFGNHDWTSHLDSCFVLSAQSDGFSIGHDQFSSISLSIYPCETHGWFSVSYDPLYLSQRYESYQWTPSTFKINNTPITWCLVTGKILSYHKYMSLIAALTWYLMQYCWIILKMSCLCTG